MSSRFIRRGAVLGALLAALLVAGPASAATMRGTVVHQNHGAHSFVLASRGGRLFAIHASRSPSVGRNVLVSATRLRNGTFAARKVTVGKRTRRALIRGVVTFVDRGRGSFTVSSRGVSVLVHRSSRGAHAADALPSVGDPVEVQTQIDDQGDLQDENVQVTGAPQTQNMDLEGTILAVDPVARTLSVSADDSEESGRSVTVAVPATIDISAFTVGQQVGLTVTMQADGSFLLQAASGDDNAQEANDSTDQQGCQGDSSGGSACSSGSAGSSSDGSGSSGSGGGD
jgi:uncharacterized membrane protein YgcG